MPENRVRLEVDGPIAVIVNANPERHNAFDDSMDARLFELLAQLKEMPEIRAIIWRAEGKSWSSGRDVRAIGGNAQPLRHDQLMRRGRLGIQQIFDLQAPIIVAIHGWAIGGSFQRALQCDIRIAAADAKFRLPEVTHGVIPDVGGVARLFQMCGHGVVSDLVLSGRVMDATEALAHGIVSRVVPNEQLDTVALEIAHNIAAAPTATVGMARRVIRNLSEPEIRASMADEEVFQTAINRSHDFAEFQAARLEERAPSYDGS